MSKKTKATNKTSAFDKGRLLLEAAQEGDIIAVEKLLRQGANPNTKDMDGFCALSYAVMEDCSDIVRLLVESGADVQMRLQGTYVPDGASLLMLSAGPSKNLIVPKFLLEKGVDINAKDKSGNTALMYAANADNPLMCEFLLANGAELEAKNLAGDTALTACAKSDCPEAARVLLDAGASMGELLHVAAHEGCPEACRVFLERGVDANQTETASGKNVTALMLAALNGNIEVARALIEKGANIDAQDTTGKTALMIAAFSDEDTISRLLIEQTSNIDAVDEEGRSALFFAIQSPWIVKMLLAYGASVNIQDSSGDTPLMVAVKHGDVLSMKAMLAAGADISISNKEGATALSMAHEGTEVFRCDVSIGCSPGRVWETGVPTL